MKKVVSLSMAILSLLMVTGCEKEGIKSKQGNEFIALGNDETLCVGAADKYKNVYDSKAEEAYLEYPACVTYTLRRSSFNDSTNAVSYGGYYYSWSVSQAYDSFYLGHKTTISNVLYSYIKYGKDEDLILKTHTETVTKYDYESGIRELPREYILNLGNYFASEQELRNNCLDLYKNLDTSTTQKIYVAATERTTTNVNVQRFNTYWYIEKVN